MSHPTTRDARFTPAQAEETYGIRDWADGYFEAGADGEMQVRVPAGAASIAEAVRALPERGRTLPAILRFPQIIEDRLDRVNEVFAEAIEEAGYRGSYQGVYPIKVNQRRVVVETIAGYGAKWRTGLEAGSKAELALILAQEMHPEALICCNGFKDDDFVRLALWGRKLGRNVVITLEKPSELERVLRLAEEMEVRPAIGARFKLHARGSGQWEESGGDEAKFGLTAGELVRAVTRLRELGLGDALVMLHCHVGSQLTDVRRIKVAVREVAQAYVELHELGVHPGYLNVGGGLAVDYDGSKTSFYVSANYGLREYADTVVWTVLEACEEAGVAHPTLVTESGRALTAHHAVAVIPVIDVIGPNRPEGELPPLPDDAHSLVRDMRELLDDVTVKNYREVHHEAMGNKDTMHSLFDLGYLSLLERAHIEGLYRRILKRIARVISTLDYVPDEFETLPKRLSDRFVANFSVFQTLPDHWAIGALFPIVPLTRLNEEPTRDATLVDISCDSDGKIDKFIDLRDVKTTLPLHEPRENEPYWLAAFLTGAYQDVLANAHNLFGRVHEAHVRVHGDEVEMERFVRGQKARRVIENMGYQTPELQEAVRAEVEAARGEGRLEPGEAEALLERYGHELVGYTYLEEV